MNLSTEKKRETFLNQSTDIIKEKFLPTFFLNNKKVCREKNKYLQVELEIFRNFIRFGQTFMAFCYEEIVGVNSILRILLVGNCF